MSNIILCKEVRWLQRVVGQEHGYDAHVLPDYSVQVDMERRYTEVSAGFCTILGYDREELIGPS
jgi:PAS domain-containing protein